MPDRPVPRPLLVAVLCACLPLHLLSQVQTVASGESLSAIRLDGRTDDWAPLSLVRDARSGALFAFRNDGRNLYILFVVDDAQVLESLASTGLTVLTGAPGARKLERGVLFLKREAPTDIYIRWHESQGVFLTEAEKAKLREIPQHDLCLTFSVGARGSTYGPLRRLHDSNPPEFGVSEGADGTTYELKVPLPPSDLVPGGIGAAPGETVRISFEWGGVARKILGTKAIRETPPAEAGGLNGVATPAQEFLNMFDPLSRPTTSTRRFSFAVAVTLAEAK